ncbi:MAG: hypothetical protein IPM77_01725 [Crocinitomicaceae bacterium]|nr:hypothetical protein [Crocinitomicaceae bacterium]
MKKIYFLLSLFLFGAINSSRAQVNILYTPDSINMECFTGTALFDFVVNAEAPLYSPSDVPVIFIDFGDGNSITYNYTDFALTYPYINYNTLYAYTAPGIYDVTYIITMPDMATDTVINYSSNSVFPCELVSGTVYHDVNSNCILEVADNPLEQLVIANDAITGNFLAAEWTDVNGYYELAVPAGSAVELTLSPMYSSSIYVCPATGVITTTGPSSGNDFALNSTGFDLIPSASGGFFQP